MADIRIVPGSSIMSFTSSLNFTEKITQDASGSLNLYGSGSTGRTELFSIDGNNGRLFTVSDDLSDSLFSVNTIAGLPVIEAFANNTVVMGQYGTNALVVSGSNVGIGTTTPSEKLDVNGYVKATGFKTSSGTATQFLMADGSTNSNTYVKTDGTGATGTWGINISGNASKLNPLSGDSNYKLAYTADGARTNAGEWGRAVMYYVPNGQTYGIRVDRADYADNAGSVGGYTASSLWRSDGGTWTQNASITLNQTANDQEWSFDMYRNGYIGGYWHVWDSTNGSILRARADTGRVSAPYSFDTPIFYDSNNTGYYVDPASTTVLSTLNVNNYLDLSSHLYTRANIYNLNSAGNGWNLVVDRNGGNHNIYGATFYDSNNTGYYLDPSSTGTSLNIRGIISNPSVWINNGDNYNGYNENIRLFNAPNGVSVIGFGASGTSGTPQSAILGYSDRYEVRVGAGNQWQQRSYDGYTEIYGSSRAPLFYDSNNTGYYLDPASTSVLNALTVGGSSVVTNNGGTWGINITGNANTANTATNASYLTTNYAGGQQLNPQTYFNNNVGVKVAMTAAAGVWSDTLWINGYNGGDVLSMCALHFQRNGTPRMYISTQNSTATSYGTLYEVLSNYGGTGTYSTTGDFRAPIFYDSNNTAYYVDPASTSNLNIIGAAGRIFTGFDSGIANSISCNNWFRSSGATGWYNSDYNGGWYMADTTWVRSYANKNIYTGGVIQADSAMYSALYYDNNNTAYYVDPASTSNVNIMQTSVTYLGNSSTYALGASYWAGASGYPGYQYTGGNHRFGFSSTSGQIDVYTDGYFYCGIDPTGGNRLVLFEDAWLGSKYFSSGGAIYGTIFYDSNNSGYYCDPSSTSNMNVITLAGYIISSTPQGITSGTKDTQNYSSFRANTAVVAQSDDTFYPIVTGYSQVTGQGYYNTPSFGFMRPTTNINGDAVISNRGDGLSTLYWKFKYNGDFVSPGDVIAYSDARFKENIETIPNAIEKVKAIRGVTYTRKDAQEGDEDVRHMGVIAQELLEIVPEVVKGTENTNYSVAYGNLTALLIEAIKEQQKQIDELKELIKNK